MDKSLELSSLSIDGKKLHFCGTVLEQDEESMLAEVESFLQQGVDMLEIRGDGLLQQRKNTSGWLRREVHLLRILEKIHEMTPDTPILFTLRSQKEGGEFNGTLEEYIELLDKVALWEGIDAMDLELLDLNRKDSEKNTSSPAHKEYNEKDFIDYIHKTGKKVILSKHIMRDIPFEERLKIAEEALKCQESSNADICKLAVYVDNETQKKEYQELLMRHNIWLNRPHIGIAMGEAGKESRYNKDWCGSCISFVCGKKVAAQGQMSMEEILELCYNS